MIKKVVTQDNTRPFVKGNEIECGYCTSVIGEEHKKGCVCRKKLININVTINMTTTVPEDWTKEEIEFHYNEGTWCASNIVDEIKEFSKRQDCLCQQIKIVHLNDIEDK